MSSGSSGSAGSSGFASEVELLGVLVRAGKQARETLTATDCDLIVDICSQVIAMAPTLPGGHIGHAARAGAELLLENSVPGVDAGLRAELARTVETIVVRRCLDVVRRTGQPEAS
jgi:hypothetical protein